MIKIFLLKTILKTCESVKEQMFLKPGPIFSSAIDIICILQQNIWLITVLF